LLAEWKRRAGLARTNAKDGCDNRRKIIETAIRIIGDKVKLPMKFLP